MTKNSVFQYENYRHFLKDVYEAAKKEDRKFSFRYFARITGFKSPNAFKRIIDGQRNLTPAAVEKFIVALKLTKDEGHFFRNLVLLNQAKTVDEKQIYSGQLLKSQIFKKISPLSESQFNYYNHWYFVAIRELVGTPWFKEDAEWIAKQLSPSITPAEAAKAIDELLKLKLILRDAHGKLVQSNTIVTTSVLTSSGLAQFHREMIKKAGESIDRHQRELREISSVTLNLPLEHLDKFKEMVHKFRVELMEAAAKEPHRNCLYQLNFQLFPLSHCLDKKEGEDPQ